MNPSMPLVPERASSFAGEVDALFFFIVAVTIVFTVGISAALVFFAAGVTVAYVVLPFAIGFLSSFGTGELQNAWTADGYFGFVATMFVGFGLVMEFPIVLVLLSKVGIVTSARLKASRRYVIIVFAIVAAVATPGGDIISPFVLGVTMYGLYELSILLVRAGGR